MYNPHLDPPLKHDVLEEKDAGGRLLKTRFKGASEFANNVIDKEAPQREISL